MHRRRIIRQDHPRHRHYRTICGGIHAANMPSIKIPSFKKYHSPGSQGNILQNYTNNVTESIC